MDTSSFPPTNQLLDRLPDKDRQRFLADCETVEMTFAQILVEPEDAFSHAFFPLGCAVSLIVRLESGGRLAVSMVGHEGMLGIPLMLDEQKSTLQVLVQEAGLALQIPAATFQKHLAGSPALEKLMKHYLNVIMIQTLQSAACINFHVLEARMARWLLMAHDKTCGRPLHLTHEGLSMMLGVRRASVTRAALGLQARGLITYQRGLVRVQDRAGLEEASCCCYAADCKSYGQILEQNA
ncbi:Crp/Fnr family transcriptional regulator [Halomonas sp. CH40]